MRSGTNVFALASWGVARVRCSRSVRGAAANGYGAAFKPKGPRSERSRGLKVEIGSVLEGRSTELFIVRALRLCIFRQSPSALYFQSPSALCRGLYADSYGSPC